MDMRKLDKSIIDIARVCEENDQVKFREFTNIKNWLDFLSIDDYIDVQKLDSHKKYLSNRTTVLCIANQYSRADFVKELLDRGASAHLSDGFYDTPLHKACRSTIDVVPKVDLLIGRNKDLLKRCNENGNTPLHIAALSRDHTVSQRLLEEEANVNAVSRKGLTPLHVASYFGQEKVADIVLRHPDVDVNMQDENGDTPLHVASSKSRVKIIKQLKQHPKCNPELRNLQGFTADQENPINLKLLDEAQNGSATAVQILINIGAICISDRDGDTPLHKACMSKREQQEKANILFTFDKAQINVSNRWKYLPIHIAAENENVTLLQFLINKMDRTILASHQIAVLSIALRLGNIQIVKLLLDNDINKKIRETTVACLASLHSTSPFLQELLRCGANVKAVDSIGDTTLHKACRSVIDPRKKVEMLIKEESSMITQCNKNGVTPLHVAATCKDHAIAKILLENGAEVNASSNKFLSPLHIASHFGRIKIVDLLLLRPKIDVNMQDSKGDTAMHHASAHGFTEILKKLRDFPGCLDYLTNKAGLTADQENPLNLKLLRAAQKDDASSVEALLKNGAICVQDERGETPLHKACESEVDAFCKTRMLLLYDRKQRLLPNKADFYPIHLAAKNCDPKVLDLLLKECDVNSEMQTAIHIAVFYGKTKNVGALLEVPEINLAIKDREGESILHIAVIQDHQEILSLIVDHAKCQPNIENNAGFTALHVAVQRKNISCVEILLRSKAININATDKQGNTAAHHASLNEYWDILRLIQSHPNYEFSVRNEEGKTVDQVNVMNANFVEMCEIGSTFILKRLLIGGAKLITDANGRTCLHRACLSDIEPTKKCELLLDIQPEMINFTDSSGETPLHAACKRQDSELTTFLLGLPNIDANIKNSKHRAPLHVTVMNDKIENTAALLSHEKILVNIQDDRGDTASHIAAAIHSYAHLELLQAHPNFDTKITNGIFRTASQIWRPYGRLSRLPELTWYKHGSVSVEAATYPFPSLSLIGDHLYCCCDETVYIYNQALEQIGRFDEGDMGPVFQVTELKNEGLVAAAGRGLYHLTLTGEIISRIASGRYNSVTTYEDKLYAVREVDEHTSIEVYTRGESWQQHRVIPLPCDGRHRATVLVTSQAIYACCEYECKVYVVSGDGEVVQTVGRRGRKEPGGLRYPRLCHSDDTDNVLVADMVNGRLQVLSRDHAWSVLPPLPLGDDWVHGAVYIPGRLYVVHGLPDSHTLTLFLPRMY